MPRFVDFVDADALLHRPPVFAGNFANVRDGGDVFDFHPREKAQALVVGKKIFEGLAVARADAREEFRELLRFALVRVEIRGERASVADDAAAERFEPRHALDDSVERFRREALVVALAQQGNVFRAELEQHGVHLRVVFDVLLFLFALHFVERRLRDVDVARVNQPAHVAEKERQQQRADVRAVDIGVRHDDDFVIARLFDVEFRLFVLPAFADARAERRDHRLDFRVFEHFVEADALHVENLPAQRQNRLRAPIPSLFGGAAGGIALDEIDFALRGIFFRAVRQFPGKTAALKRAFADGFPRLARGFAGARGVRRRGDDRLRRRRFFFKNVFQTVSDDGLHDALDFRIRQPRFVLRLKLRVGMFDGNDGDQPFLHVVPGQLRVLILDQVVRLRVIVHDAGERRAESGKVRPAFGVVDQVRVGVDDFRVFPVVLKRDVHRHFRNFLRGIGNEIFRQDDGLRRVGDVDFRRDQNRIAEKRLFAGIEVGNVFGKPFFVMERFLVPAPLVLDGNRDAGNEEREFPQPPRERVVFELQHSENLRIRKKRDFRSRLLRFPEHANRRRHLAAAKLHVMHFSVAADFRLEEFRKRVHALRADAVEPAGNLIRAFLEFPARVKIRQHELQRRNFFLRVNRNGNAAAVVLDGDGAVPVNRDFDFAAEARERLVDGIVDDFVNAVVKPRFVRVADVHARAFPHGLQPFQALDVGRVVGRVALAFLPLVGRCFFAVAHNER